MCLLLKGTMSSGGERVWSVGACNPTWETTAPQVWTTLAERKRRRRRRTGWQLNGHCALGLTSTGNGNELMDFLWGRNNLSDDDFNKSWNVDAVTEGLTWASWNSGLKKKTYCTPQLHYYICVRTLLNCLGHVISWQWAILPHPFPPLHPSDKILQLTWIISMDNRNRNTASKHSL